MTAKTKAVRLREIRRAAEQRRRADARWKELILAAVESKSTDRRITFKEIGEAAGLTPQGVVSLVSRDTMRKLTG